MVKCDLCQKKVNATDIIPYTVSGHILWVCPDCVSKVTLVVKESEE